MPFSEDITLCKDNVGSKYPPKVEKPLTKETKPINESWFLGAKDICI